MDSKLYSNTLGYAGSGGQNAPSLLAPGMVIDRFQLEEKLHVGGMAHLWRVSEVNHAGDLSFNVVADLEFRNLLGLVLML
jgi:hypothetical protein